MDPIFERLRRALAPEYDLEAEIGRGGMGVVYRARDVKLNHLVAVKVLRPELATARAAERFLTEAQILANLRHNNVVRVISAHEGEGLYFYLMDYLKGDTLADRLQRGPLPKQEALKFGRDLLAALEAAHRVGIIHRDVKPSNVFLMDGQAVLTDFGIATPSDQLLRTQDRLKPQGTLGYMSPEQAMGGELTPRSDLYSAAMVIYEAYTARRWCDVALGEGRKWRGVPLLVVPVLKRALQMRPQDRWPDARSFRRKLWVKRVIKYRVRTAALTVLGLGVGSYAAWRIFLALQPIYDVAIAPFDATPDLDLTLASELTVTTSYNLDDYLSVAPRRVVEDWWSSRGGSLEGVGRAPNGRRLRSRYVAHAKLSVVGNDTVVEIKLLDGEGTRRSLGTEGLGRISANDTLDLRLARFGHRLGLAIARVVKPDSIAEYQAAPGSAEEATTALLAGLRAFRLSRFKTAWEHFDEARRIDPNFGLASWWLSNAWRWRRPGGADTSVDLRDVLDRRGQYLSKADSLLIEAQLAPDPFERIAIYKQALRENPGDAYAAFLYAEDLQSRGPLVGISLEHSTSALDSAYQKDTTFAPVLQHLVFGYLRLGRADNALRDLRRYELLTAGLEEEVDYHLPRFLPFARIERFQPDSANEARKALMDDTALVGELRGMFRAAPLFDLANTQAELAQGFLRDPGTDDSTRAHFHEARGLGLIATGRITAALQHLDSAAALFDSLEALEWRIIPFALGVPGIPPDERARAGEAAARFDPDSALRARAWWVRGIDAVNRRNANDIREALDALHALQPDTTAARLLVLLRAMQFGANGQVQQALRTSEGLLAYDSAGRVGDPFGRAVLHMKRADWLDSLGLGEAADSARRWYEHFEWMEHFPTREAQSSEVDWALGTYARWLRANTALDRGDTRRACGYLRRIAELWTDGDSAYQELRREAGQLVSDHCPP